MINTINYTSPVGEILLASRDGKLIGLWFEGQKHYLSAINGKIVHKDDEILEKTSKWLDDYFNSKQPDIKDLDISPVGSDFRLQVWELLCEIPYGKTVTYGDIAERIAEKRGIPKMSAQAVGGAVGHNPISIIIPCHRVIGADGSLTGYAGGIDRKLFLLNHENVDVSGVHLPKNGVAH